MKLNLGKQVLTVENRNLNSIIRQCIEQKIKERVVELAKREFFEIDNKTVPDVTSEIMKKISVDTLLEPFDEKIIELLARENLS